MTITISNLTVSNDVSAGTMIGLLTARDPSGNIVPCNYTVTKGAIGYFSISGNQLLTAWSISPTPGYYSVRVHAVGTTGRFSGSGTFMVNVVMAAPPPAPSAPVIEVNGSGSAKVVAGSTMTISVTNGPGNPTDWVGWALASAPQDSGGNVGGPWVYANGTQTAPTTGESAFTVSLAGPTTAGSYIMRFFASDSFTLLASVPFTVTAPPSPPPPPVITVTPAMPELPDTTPLGAVVATFTVAMSDGSKFTGTVGFGPPFYDAGGIFALSGNSIIVNPAGPGLGPNMTSVSDYITLEATP